MEVTSQHVRTVVFIGRRWFRTLTKYFIFKKKHVPKGKLQCFIDVVTYLNFFVGEIAIPGESQLGLIRS